jgi:DNA repair protein RadC
MAIARQHPREDEQAKASTRAGVSREGGGARALMLAGEEQGDGVQADEARERPRIRERAREVGVELLDDEELLALLIERGVVGEPLEPRVARLLREAGGLDGLASLGVSALAEDHGLGLARGARVAAAIELGLRVARHAKERGAVVASSSEDVERWGRARLAHLAHEELWALLLDARNRLVGERLVARGGLHACATTPRDVLRPVVREATHAFVLVHNHPGGDPCPSREDAFFTRRVAEAAEVLGVALVDHVIVARDGYVSMLESGMLDERHGSRRARGA